MLHHAKVEEQELFKLAKQYLSKGELGALGEQLEGRRNELMQEEDIEGVEEADLLNQDA